MLVGAKKIKKHEEESSVSNRVDLSLSPFQQLPRLNGCPSTLRAELTDGLRREAVRSS